MMHITNGRTRPMRAFACLMTMTLLLSAAAGCTQFPALDDTVTPQATEAPYPALVPLDPLQVETQGNTGSVSGTQEQALKARADALRARAAALQAESP